MLPSLKCGKQRVLMSSAAIHANFIFKKYISPAGKLISIKVSDPLEWIGVDLNGPYSLSENSFLFVLVIVDLFSKLIEFIPLRKASAVVSITLFNNFISKYDAPIQAVSDHEPCFISDIFCALCWQLEISHYFTVPYLPQSYMAERVFDLKISSYIDSHRSNWD